MKCFGIMLEKEISRQCNSDFATWLPVIALMQIYNEKEQVEPQEIQNVQFEEGEKKTVPRICNVGAKSFAQGDEKFKKGLRRNGVREW